MSAISNISTPGSSLLPSTSSNGGDASDRTGGQAPAKNPSVQGNQVEARVRAAKQIELSQKGQRLVKLQVVGETFAPGQAPESVLQADRGMKAVMITQDENAPSRLNFSVLRVFGNGQTETLLSTGDQQFNELAGQSEQDLRLRGNLLDQSV